MGVIIPVLGIMAIAISLFLVTLTGLVIASGPSKQDIRDCLCWANWVS